jgi:fused signal recognition particle receptor
MFDGLKDTLDRFRKDAEKATEEKAEPVADGEALDSAEVSGDAVAADVDVGAEAGGSTADATGDTTADATGDTTADATGDTTADATGDTKTEATGDTAPDATGDETGGDADTDREGSGASLREKLGSAMRGRVVIEPEDLEGPLWDLEMALLSSDVEMSVAEEMLDTIKADLVGEERKFTTSTAGIIEDALRDALLSVTSVGQFDFDQRIRDAEKPVVIVFTGVNGVGKTTSIAKLSRYLEDRGLSTVMANGDTYRAGANEQIREHAANLDTKLISHEMGGDPAAVIYDAVEYAEAHDIDVVLGDTAGRLHTSNDLMEQLAKIHRVVDPDLTLFVDEAVAGQDAVNRAREFNDAAEIDGTILTMADADSQGGAAISVAHVTGKPILFLGTGQGYDDLERFDPDALVADLLGD